MSVSFTPGAVGQYRPDIDGLRAIAIVAVVAFHAGMPGLSGGFVGVDIFFVLSGFLITSMLFKEAEQTGQIDLSEFYARRVRRLLPAATLVLIVSVVLAYFYLIPIGDEQLKFARSAFASALFVSNIFFWTSSGGYFDGPSDQIPLLHTWSLSVEEQFYLIWPLLLIGIVRFAEWRGLKLRSLVLCALAVMFLCSLATSVWLSQVSPSAGFYLLPSRIWELAAGAFTGVILQNELLKQKLKQKWFATLLALTGMAAICWAVLFFDAGMAFPGWVALLPVLGTVSVLIAGAISDGNLVSRLLSTPPMVLIGKLSYSWYLWHWPLLAFLKIENLGENELFQNLIAAFIALILASLTYHYIENPIRYSRKGWFATTRGALKMGILLIVFSILVTALMLSLRGFVQVTSLAKKINFAYSDHSPLTETCSRNGSKPLNVLKNADCETGNKNNLDTIIVWGDSHSDHWMPLINEQFKSHQIVQYSMPGCPPLQGNRHAMLKNCHTFNDQVIESLGLNSNIKGVILAARWPAYIGSSAIQIKQKSDDPIYFDVSAKSTQDALNILAISLNRTLTTLAKHDLKILVMAPTPEFKYPVPVCVFRKTPEYCQSSRIDNDLYREKVLNVLNNIVAKHPNARLANSYESLCDSMYCFVIKNDHLLYKDGDHLTGTGAKLTLNSVKNELAWFGNQTK